MSDPRADRPAIRVEEVSKRYGSTQALSRASLEVAPGAIHALAGGNGSGKSTLIKILAGVVAADAGEIAVGDRSVDASQQTPRSAKEMGLHFVHQQSTAFPDLTVAENLALGRGFERSPVRLINWRAQRRRAAELIDRFEIDADVDQEVSELSAATQTLVGIARALQDQDSASEGVLVLDEPTASLPAREVDALLGALRRYAAAGRTIVYVSHRLGELTAVADRATVLRDGRVVATLEADELSHERLAAEIIGPSASAAERAVSAVHRARRQEARAVLELDPTSDGEQRLVVREGEIVGVAGLLGSGRTSLLRAIFGLGGGHGRTVKVRGETLVGLGPRGTIARGVALVPENRAQAAFVDRTVAENLSIAQLELHRRPLGLLSRGSERNRARELISSFAIRASSEQALMSSLSGGNQQKVVVGRWLQRRPGLLLLDEPTQGVDVGARAQIHELIARLLVDSPASAVLMVSSDFDELAELSDRAYVIRAGRIEAAVTGQELTADRLNELAYTTEAAT